MAAVPSNPGPSTGTATLPAAREESTYEASVELIGRRRRPRRLGRIVAVVGKVNFA
jgi:hypothetical protein